MKDLPGALKEGMQQDLPKMMKQGKRLAMKPPNGPPDPSLTKIFQKAGIAKLLKQSRL